MDEVVRSGLDWCFIETRLNQYNGYTGLKAVYLREIKISERLNYRVTIFLDLRDVAQS